MTPLSETKWFSAAIVGAAFILGAIAFGVFYYSAQGFAHENVLSVTGSAKTSVVSDEAKLVISITRTAPVGDLAGGYRNLARDLSLTEAMLQKAGIASSSIVESPVSMYQMYNQKLENSQGDYQLSQTATVQSDDVAGITALSKKVPDLAASGVVASVQSLEYYYSKLPDARVSLLADAVKDAKARADEIAAGSGEHVGSIASAASGVVQVLAPNSVNISDYGSYDTSSIDKDIMVTVKVDFRLAQ